MNAIFRISYIAIRELIYEKVFYLFFSFALAALLISLLLGQLTYAEQTKLTLDFMLAGTQLSMVLFAIFMGISLFQKEIQHGSIAMVLSKPILRSSFVMGKYFGQFVVQSLVTLAMTAITLAVVLRFQTPISKTAIIQCSLLTTFEIGVIASVTYLFAVNTGAVTSAIGSFAFFLIGYFIDPFSTTVPKSDTLRFAVWEVMKSAIPNLQMFNIKSLASYGISIPWAEIGIAGLYAGTCITMYLTLAILTFSRKDLFT